MFIHKEDITMINIYPLSNRQSRFIKQKLTKLKGEIGSLNVMVGDFNSPLLKMDRTSRPEDT